MRRKLWLQVSAFLFILVQVSASFAQNGRFPIKPDTNLTPGQLCAVADEIRYPEKIKYCERDVSTFTKQSIILTYDAKLGYNIRNQNRAAFKIDHYIPLCMGGSNERQNLWPQHQSVYKHTDPLEGLLCEKMKYGKIKQADAINLIRQAKNDLTLIPQILRFVSRL